MHGQNEPSGSRESLSSGEQFFAIIAQIREYLELYQALGTQGMFGVHQRPQVPMVLTLDQLADDLKDCQRCKLHNGRTHVVFGAGNPQAALVFIGEAPGEQEDLQGQPFIGPAGELLTKIIEAIGLRREEVYLTSVIKCRPPDNRNPEPDELATCAPFLHHQLQLIQPKIICALGAYAAQTLLQTTDTISQLRGRFHDYHGIKLMPTYHPAYLLRKPTEKRLVWQDMQLVQKAYAEVTTH
jgi:uracil-DNA glycosylase